MSRGDDHVTLARADELLRSGRVADAIDAYLEVARLQEVPSAETCLGLARSFHQAGDFDEAVTWLLKVVDSGDSFVAWQGAAALLERALWEVNPPAQRSIRLAVLGSTTTAQLVPLVRLAALRRGIDADVYEAPYGQYRQEILNPESRFYSFEPDFVVLAVHEGDVTLPEVSEAPNLDLADELERWRSLWQIIADRSGARVVQHNFALRPEGSLGHLSVKVPGSRNTMLQRLNAWMGEMAGESVVILDCERLAGSFGKDRWFDERYWFLSKQAVAFDALPLVARHTAAVLAAQEGLSRKCLVFDLDNTIWGGIIGEDGLAGIQLGGGPAGEAYVALQDYLLSLKRKGVILAVCSKNDPTVARVPFEHHPDMRIRLDDVAVFVANWEPKPESIKAIAGMLDLGLDALAFLDDNPAEREAVRQMLPEVEVIPLPADPAHYRRALSQSLLFETATYTQEDARRTSHYQARARIAELKKTAGSLEDFYRSLEMHAEVGEFDEFHLPRIVQLIGKTNQFNLTTRRHSAAEARAFMDDPGYVTQYLKLSDRLTEHGLVGVLIARRGGDVLEIDTWLMSCRVIGRTVEREMLAHLCRQGLRLGVARIRGTYIPTRKNGLVENLYDELGFELIAEEGGMTTWEYDLAVKGLVESQFIESSEVGSDAA